VAIVSIGWFRDLVLCIFGLGATAAIIILVVLAFLFYFRLKPMFDSMKKTARIVENITTTVEEEVAGPLAQMASFVQGIRQAFNLFNRFARKGED
jgi:hypothetical protein